MFAVESAQAVDTLEIEKLNEQENLPEHDQLYLDRQAEIKKAAEAEEAEPDDASGDDGAFDTGTPAPEDGDGTDADPDAEGGEGKEGQTLSSPESDDLREKGTAQDSEESDTVQATESYSDSTAARALGAAGRGAVSTLGWAFGVAKDLAVGLKDLGIEYGPGILRRVRGGVALVADRFIKLFLKMLVKTSEGMARRKVSYEKSMKRLTSLKATLQLIQQQDGAELISPEPFRDQDLFDLFFADNKLDPMNSVTVVEGLMKVMTDSIDGGMDHDVRVIEQLIDNTKRGVRFSVMSYMSLSYLAAKFTKKAVQGYTVNPELMECYAYPHALPRNILLLLGLPKNELFAEQANLEESLEHIAKAYHSSFIVLGVNPVRPKSMPLVNYVDADSLGRLLDKVAGLITLGQQHVALYENNVKRAEKLKLSYRQYFAWLTATEEQKSLKESMVELIYLKQAFITKAYLPAMLDIHDYVASYISAVLKYAESNIKVIQPKAVDPDSAV